MISKDQALQLHPGDELHYGECVVTVGPRGGEKLDQERWRVNGSMKTWKTRPDEFRIPLKHGFRGPFHYLDQDNTKGFHLATDCNPTRRDKQ